MLARPGIVVALVASGFIALACARTGAGGLGAHGTLTGRVTRGPMFPVSGPGAPTPAEAPVAEVELKIIDNNSGALVATARTGADGYYQVTLPAGDYRVERGAAFPGATKNLPARVAISPGGQTRYDVLIDTGIR